MSDRTWRSCWISAGVSEGGGSSVLGGIAVCGGPGTTGTTGEAVGSSAPFGLPNASTGFLLGDGAFGRETPLRIRKDVAVEPALTWARIAGEGGWPFATGTFPVCYKYVA